MTADCDDRAFLAAVHAAPGDPLPRLIYADWLDERGRHADSLFQRVLAEPGDDCWRLLWADAVESGDAARAEFVRVQVALAGAESAPCRCTASHHNRSGTCDRCRRAEPLRRRGGELLATEWESLIPTVAGLAKLHVGWLSERRGESGTAFRAVFRRGFVAEVTLPWPDWQAHAAALLAACPIRHAKDGLVRLTTWPEVWAADASRPAGRDNLRFGFGPPSAGGQYAVAASNPATPVRGLILEILAAHFPGIEFALPFWPGPGAPWAGRLNGTPAAGVRDVQAWARRAGTPLTPGGGG